MLDRDAEFLLVTDRDRGAAGSRRSPRLRHLPVTAGVSLHEQLRRARTADELVAGAVRVPGMLGDLLSWGLASGKVIAVYSTFLDAITRRAIGLVFAQHPELSVDAFTWLSLGSNGRREAVPSSDVDSAVAFDDAVPPEASRLPGRLRRGVRGAGAGRPQWDGHGATAQHPRSPGPTPTGGRRREVAGRAGRAQRRHDDLAAGGRPPHPRRPRPPGGDPGRSATCAGTRARCACCCRSRCPGGRSCRRRGILARRAETFDIKAHALLPVVNLARWAALSVGSAVLPTTERLRAAAGSAMLPAEQARP